jgi:hypothetical protein
MPSAACPPPGPPPRHLAAVPDDRVDRRARVVDRLRTRIQAGEVEPFDGMVWLAHLDRDGRPRLFSRVSDPVTDLDELYLLDLLSTLEAIGLPAVTVAIWRASGQPVAVDRRLARDLTARLGTDGPTVPGTDSPAGRGTECPNVDGSDGRTVLDAVVVVNATGYRVVRPGRSGRRTGPPAADLTGTPGRAGLGR